MDSNYSKWVSENTNIEELESNLALLKRSQILLENRILRLRTDEQLRSFLKVICERLDGFTPNLCEELIQVLRHNSILSNINLINGSFVISEVPYQTMTTGLLASQNIYLAITNGFRSWVREDKSFVPDMYYKDIWELMDDVYARRRDTLPKLCLMFVQEVLRM